MRKYEAAETAVSPLAPSKPSKAGAEIQTVALINTLTLTPNIMALVAMRRAPSSLPLPIIRAAKALTAMARPSAIANVK